MTVPIKDYETPAFLQTETADTIYKRMTEVDVGNGRMAKDILDVSQGSMFWDACRPAALEKEMLIQYQLNEVIKSAFIQYANEDADLDIHGQTHGVPRNPATQANVTIIVTGVYGTFIPGGFRFATPTVGDVPGVEFATLQDATIPEEGTVDIPAQAVEPGSQGEVPAELISLQSQPKEGITSVNNAEKASGGVDEEENDPYRQRILEVTARNPGSGSKYDYIRWAKEVSGVGDAYCIPEWMGPGTGTVKVLVIDTTGEPANEVIVQRVREHICGPNGDDGMAPTDAIVTVAAPIKMLIRYYATLILAADADSASIIADFRTAILQYYERARKEKEKVLRYNFVTATMTGVPGVKDYQDITMRLEDTVVSYIPEYERLVLTKGHPDIKAGDLLLIDGTDYAVASYDHLTKTVEFADGPVDIVDDTILIRIGNGRDNISLPLDYYPVTGSVTITAVQSG